MNLLLDCEYLTVVLAGPLPPTPATTEKKIHFAFCHNSVTLRETTVKLVIDNDKKGHMFLICNSIYGTENIDFNVEIF